MNGEKLFNAITKVDSKFIDRAASAGETGVNTDTKSRASRSWGSGRFRMRPVLAVEAIIVFIAVIATIVAIIAIKQRSGKVNTQPTDGADTTLAEETTPTPALPTPAQQAVELVNVSQLIGDDQLGRGLLWGSREKNLDELFEALLAAGEAGNTGPLYYGYPVLDYGLLERITFIEDYGYDVSNFFEEKTPREIEGLARVYVCKYHGEFDMILAGESIYYTLDRAELKVGSAVPFDYDNNGVKDILLMFVQRPSPFSDFIENDPDALYWTGYYVLDMARGELVEICSVTAPLELPYILNSGGKCYIYLDSSQMGGEVKFEGERFTIGGTEPEIFVKAMYETRPEQLPSDKITVNATPAPTAVPPTEKPYEELPTMPPTEAPTGPTPIPWDDPNSVQGIADHNSFIEVCQEGRNISGPDFKEEFYYFDGNEMKTFKWSPDAQIEEAMMRITRDIKEKREFYAYISARKDFSVAHVTGGDIISVDVYTVNDAENWEQLTFDRVATGLGESEFMEYAASSMPFRQGSNGEPLPCFAVFHTGINGQFISAAGEYEYVIKSSLVTFVP